jgi:hypothetical protein
MLVVCLSTTIAAQPAESTACVLRAPMPVHIHTKHGDVEAAWPVGTEVTSIGTGALVRVRAGATTGTAQRATLAAACEGQLRTCQSRAPVSMYAEARSDSTAQELPMGTQLHIRRSGKLWAEVGTQRSGEGFVLVGALRGCAAEPGVAVANNDSTDVVESVERGEGPGIWVVPLRGDARIPAGIVDGLGGQLWDVFGRARPDAVRAASEGEDAAKTQLSALLLQAQQKQLAYVLGGRAVLAADGQINLEVSVYDVKARKQLKGVRVVPASNAEWPAEVTLALWDHMRSSPGQQRPLRSADRVKGFEVSPLQRR